jgi:hypothetical protein
MKKFIIGTLLTLVTAFTFNGNSIKTTEFESPLEEVAQDVFDNEGITRINRT